MEELAHFATCKVERKGYEAIIISQVNRPGDSERALHLLSPAVTCPLHTVTTLSSPLHIRYTPYNAVHQLERYNK